VAGERLAGSVEGVAGLEIDCEGHAITHPDGAVSAHFHDDEIGDAIDDDMDECRSAEMLDHCDAAGEVAVPGSARAIASGRMPSAMVLLVGAPSRWAP